MTGRMSSGHLQLPTTYMSLCPSAMFARFTDEHLEQVLQDDWYNFRNGRMQCYTLALLA